MSDNVLEFSRQKGIPVKYNVTLTLLLAPNEFSVLFHHVRGSGNASMVEPNAEVDGVVIYGTFTLEQGNMIDLIITDKKGEKGQRAAFQAISTTIIPYDTIQGNPKFTRKYIELDDWDAL